MIVDLSIVSLSCLNYPTLRITFNRNYMLIILFLHWISGEMKAIFQLLYAFNVRFWIAKWRINTKNPVTKAKNFGIERFVTVVFTSGAIIQPCPVVRYLLSHQILKPQLLLNCWMDEAETFTELSLSCLVVHLTKNL